MWLAHSVSALHPSSVSGAVHAEPTHAPLRQSAGWRHALAAPHGVHGPPQSMSVSSPSFMRSLHAATEQPAALAAQDTGPSADASAMFVPEPPASAVVNPWYSGKVHDTA